MLHMCVDFFQKIATMDGDLLRLVGILLHTHICLLQIHILMHVCFRDVIFYSFNPLRDVNIATMLQ